MPIDGHHRLAACRTLGRTVVAWVVKGSAFEAFDCKLRESLSDERAEDCIWCGDKLALEVAGIPCHEAVCGV
jgi:hypothetical protein